MPGFPLICARAPVIEIVLLVQGAGGYAALAIPGAPATSATPRTEPISNFFISHAFL
jgi:hypothetical protein